MVFKENGPFLVMKTIITTVIQSIFLNIPDSAKLYRHYAVKWVIFRLDNPLLTKKNLARTKLIVFDISKCYAKDYI